MIVGKYIKRLLEDRTRVILPGFGNLAVILADGEFAASGNRLDPPGMRVKFDAGYSKDDGILAETVAAGELMEREEAQQKVLELVDAIKFALDKGEDFVLPEAGTFSRDEDGKVHFRADPAWVLEPDQYGLEAMDLFELEELPAEEATVPSAGKVSRASSAGSELVPPKPGPRSFRWRVIWLVAAALVVVLVVLILVPSRDKMKIQPVQEQTDISSDVPEDQDQPEAEEQSGEAESVQEEAEAVVEEEVSLEAGNNYFVIAGSFSRLNNASDLQDHLNSRGYKAEVMITENRMYRVSVASFASKAEAEAALSRIKSEPGLESCWLLSN